MCICRTQSQALFCSPCSKLTPSLPPCPMQEMQQLRQGAAAIGRTRSASNAEEGQGEAAAEAEALEEGGAGDEEARPCPRFCKVTASDSARVLVSSANVFGNRALARRRRGTSWARGRSRISGSSTTQPSSGACPRSHRAPLVLAGTIAAGLCYLAACPQSPLGVSTHV